MNKTSEITQISPVALSFAANAASFVHMVLQAPPLQCPSFNMSISCFRIWSSQSTHKSLNGPKNEVQE